MSTAGSAALPRPTLPPHRTASARAEIAYWDLGDGPAILLLHTFPDHAVGMLPLAGELADAGYRVIVPTLPGWWPSAPVPDGDYTIPAVAGDFLRLLDALEIERPCVIGHGWGGEIAYHLGAHAPERVARAVVLSVPHAAGFTARRMTFQGLQSAGYAYFLAYSPHAVLAASQPEWLTAAVSWAAPGMHREDWPTIVALLARPSEIETASRYYRCDLEHSAEPAPVQVPTLVVHGAATPAVPPELYEGLEQWFPAGLRRHLLADAGQWPHLEAPAATLALILDHLRDA